MTRYWLTGSDGQTYGPLTLDELRTCAVEGRMTPASYVCPVGGSEWKLVSEVFPDFFGVAPPPPPPPPIGRAGVGAGFAGFGSSIGATPVAGARRVPLFWSIAVTLVTLCISCFPTGFVAWFYAARANRLYAAGDAEGGRRAERAHWIWIAVSVVLAAVTAVLAYKIMGAAWDSLESLVSGSQRTVQ